MSVSTGSVPSAICCLDDDTDVSVLHSIASSGDCERCRWQHEADEHAHSSSCLPRCPHRRTSLSSESRPASMRGSIESVKTACPPAPPQRRESLNVVDELASLEDAEDSTCDLDDDDLTRAIEKLISMVSSAPSSKTAGLRMLKPCPSCDYHPPKMPTRRPSTQAVSPCCSFQALAG